MTAAARIAGRQVAAALRFRAAGGRTRLAFNHAPHPFHVTRPYHDPGDPDGMATLYLQSSSGGLYGDDDLSLDLAVEAAARVHLTTQSSTVVHHARGGGARQRMRIDVGPGAMAEVCPDPAILFAGARLDVAVSARLAEGAALVLTDAALAHDPDGGGAPFDRLGAEIVVRGPDGRLLAVERMDVDGAEWAARTGGRPCHGMALAAGAIDAEAVAQAMRAALDGAPDAAIWAGVSAFPARGVAVARFLARDGAALAQGLAAAWGAARLAMTGRPAPPRRK